MTYRGQIVCITQYTGSKGNSQRLLERELLELAGDSGDEGTNALMSDYIREQEKLVWMYSAYLG
jgi:DNA-binding ferritin-like protein